MIVADTNVWIAYLSGGSGRDVDAFEAALVDHILRMAPIVLSELLTDPALSEEVEAELSAIPVLDLQPGFWVRTGKLRRTGKSRLADTMIAQLCIDYDAVLLTRDAGFRQFEPLGLKLF